MNFDPQRFFIGLMDFFSILLPGALLTFILMGDAGSGRTGGRASELVGARGWAAFLFVSYLLGHLFFCSAPGWMSSTAGPGATRWTHRSCCSPVGAACFPGSPER